MISFDEFLKQDEADKYNMLLECNAIIQQEENIRKEVREYIINNSYESGDTSSMYLIDVDKLLEILDKVGDEK